ncbi:ribosomal protein S18 acetylase RimI-like enzyme [Streptomyces sp. 1114.5]|uniref:GNAT family N-acetyltransferase n=1 Tax=Streptomyces sp. 1114.5 TaxID=1938830 RepID=UPI000EAC9DE2|nr:N-acetyltransferase [Streptomyces sp. 1114.5]RKT20081.1 ribosomal protein S18 acetylase RimI-like enzyme [Streptomyces sp. 1114.5]
MSASAEHITARATVTIRPLGRADAEPYRAFRLEALRETPTAFTSGHAEERAKPLAATLARLAEAEQGPGALLGAFDDTGALVGTAGLKVSRRGQERHKGTLYGMAVARAAGGRGIGRALVREVLRTAAEDGRLRQVLLTVSEGNEAALRLYTACGFEVWGREPRAVLVDGLAVAKLHMVRLLDAEPQPAPADRP